MPSWCWLESWEGNFAILQKICTLRKFSQPDTSKSRHRSIFSKAHHFWRYLFVKFSGGWYQLYCARLKMPDAPEDLVSSWWGDLAKMLRNLLIFTPRRIIGLSKKEGWLCIARFGSVSPNHQWLEIPWFLRVDHFHGRKKWMSLRKWTTIAEAGLCDTEQRIQRDSWLPTLGSGDRTPLGQIPDPRSGRIVSYFYVGTEKTGRGSELFFFLLFVCFWNVISTPENVKELNINI